MNTHHALCTYRDRLDRASTDFLVVRECSLGPTLRRPMLATGKFDSPRRHPKVKTFKTRDDALQAMLGLPSTLGPHSDVACQYLVLTVIQYDELQGTYNQTRGVPFVAQYADRSINLETGEAWTPVFNLNLAELSALRTLKGPFQVLKRLTSLGLVDGCRGSSGAAPASCGSLTPHGRAVLGSITE